MNVFLKSLLLRLSEWHFVWSECLIESSYLIISVFVCDLLIVDSFVWSLQGALLAVFARNLEGNWRSVCHHLGIKRLLHIRHHLWDHPASGLHHSDSQAWEIFVQGIWQVWWFVGSFFFLPVWFVKVFFTFQFIPLCICWCCGKHIFVLSVLCSIHNNHAGVRNMVWRHHSAFWRVDFYVKILTISFKI